MWPNPQFPADLVTFTEEIPDGKLHFSCSDRVEIYPQRRVEDPVNYSFYDKVFLWK